MHRAAEKKQVESVSKGMYRIVLAISDKGKCSFVIHFFVRSISRYTVEWFEQAINPEKRIGIRPNIFFHEHPVCDLRHGFGVSQKYKKQPPYILVKPFDMG